MLQYCLSVSNKGLGERWDADGHGPSGEQIKHYEVYQQTGACIYRQGELPEIVAKLNYVRDRKPSELVYYT